MTMFLKPLQAVDLLDDIDLCYAVYKTTLQHCMGYVCSKVEHMLSYIIIVVGEVTPRVQKG